ncbi:60S ribosomal protein L6 [Vitis vinifera]|uniref:60S ribosomal protein L6 n=1 Tax=Vitis vinifera TaxID=29760 RepID=A0A438D5V3_VITVI|nr:60S ribosomal protein L6 [Vitis vinifera]
MAPRKTPRTSRNPDLIRGVGKFSRSKMYHKRGLWAIKAKNGGVFPCHEKKPVAPAPLEKLPKGKYYTWNGVDYLGWEEVNNFIFRERIVVEEEGPFKINGVPLRRVNQAYVIATSTKVDISKVNVEKFDDKYFAKEVQKKKKGEGEFFEAEKEEKKDLPQEKKMTRRLLMLH